MARYRVIITETQSYEVYVEADTEKEAEEIAEETYGCDGDIFYTNVNVALVEEESIMKNEIAKFIKESVEWLIEEQAGCCCYKLDDHLAIFVGWSAGYGEEKRDDVIQAKDYPYYGINAGIKVWTSDDVWTDFDWLNFPYYENGDVLDMAQSISTKENWKQVAEYMLKMYDEVKDLEMDDNGMIIKEEM